ncbi:MAG: homocysteine biosynthesis protein [Atribacterota bacterium]|nr:homocysteine biosynthesis protein [Atribacterota bacterium]MDD5636726.1 homocysteine biosynthesis protein [Atribacterota bacterium]
MGKLKRTYQEINEKIARKEAVVMTAEEVIALKDEQGIEEATKLVDVVTTGTFGPMCSSGAFFNVGHSDPPIKMQKVWLNDVMAYAGLAAVDIYLGATQLSESERNDYGGAHVIEEFVKGKDIRLKALSNGTDCYPAREVEATISKETVNQAFMVNPRNTYQNYNVAVNQSTKKIYTYMGILLPDLGNASYSTSGQLSPLLNDPSLRSIGIGSRIFIGGTEGYVIWEGTQFSPRTVTIPEKEIVTRQGATLALIGNLKKMKPDFIQAAYFAGYGVSLYVGIGIPIPILDEDMMRVVSIKDEEIYTEILDYSYPHPDKPSLGWVNYAQLRSGQIDIKGKKVPTSSLSSYARARIIAHSLKEWIGKGQFFLQEPIEFFPSQGELGRLKTIKIR